MKNLKLAVGVRALTKNEQKNINGGSFPPEPICGSIIWNASEAQCLAYNSYYRPVYLGNNKCSLLGDNC